MKESVVINNDIPIEDIRDKASRLALHCILDDKTKVNIEMQMYNSVDNIRERLSYYTSQLYTGQAIKGRNYTDLQNVYIILITNENVFDKRKDHFSKICYRFEDGDIFCDKLNIIVFELKKIESKSIIDMDLADKWGTFFRNASGEGNEDLLEQLKKADEGIKMASTLLQEISQDEKERAIIFEREKILNDYYAGLAYATDKGKQEGIEQGKQEGFTEGEYKKAIEIASTMKTQGFTADQISSITGLSLEEVESL